MFLNLVFGTVMIGITVIIHTAGIIALTHLMDRLTAWLRQKIGGLNRAVAMVLTVHGLFLLHTLEVWAWAVAYHLTGDFNDFGETLYLSAVTFSTLGYGDVIAPDQWRLAVSLEGINGFLLIGWSTAYLVSASTRYGPFKTGRHF